MNVFFVRAIAFSSAIVIGSNLNAATIAFKQNADAVSSDGTINITNYQGTEDNSLLRNPGGEDQNKGGDARVFTGNLSSSSSARNILIRFDVAALEGQYTSIDDITLRFYTLTQPDGSNTARLYRVKPGTGGSGNGDWVEGNSTFVVSDGSSTWFHKHQTQGGLNHAGGPWAGSEGMNTIGVDYVGAGATNDPLATFAYTPATGAEVAVDFQLSGIDLTALIDEWVDAEVNDTFGNQKNEGLFITTDFVANSQIIFWSSEENNPNNAFEPELIISYTAVPEPAAATLLLAGAAGLLSIGRRRQSSSLKQRDSADESAK